MHSKQLAMLCRKFAEDKKAENLLVLDVRKLSSVTDYFVIASGTSSPHLRAIVTAIADQLREQADLRPRAMDGNVNGDWVVLDYFDVIVHVMRAEIRARYDLESLWGDAPRMSDAGEPVAQKAKRVTRKPAAKKKAARKKTS
jgi:ribosome-associated protein